MDSTIISPAVTKCPKCLRFPTTWREQPKYGSRELFWVGCKACGFLQGAIREGVALGLWDRFVNRWKFEHASK